MPPSDFRDSSASIEMALNAIQGTLQGYKSSVDQGFRDIRDEIRQHVRDETDWQARMEDKLDALALAAVKVPGLERKVEEHDAALQQVKGAIVATKAIWAVLGFVIAGMGWLVSNAVTVNKGPPAFISPPVEIRSDGGR